MHIFNKCFIRRFTRWPVKKYEKDNPALYWFFTKGDDAPEGGFYAALDADSERRRDFLHMDKGRSNRGFRNNSELFCAFMI